MTVGVALKFGAGELNPHYFAHPHLLHYALAGLYGTIFLFGFLMRVFHSIQEFQTLFFNNPSFFYLTGRIFCASIGTLTILVLYRYGARLFGQRVGFVSAVFLATSFLHVRSSHYVRHDVPVAFMILFSSWFILNVLEYGRKKDCFYAGILSGLAVATNWNGIILAVPLSLAILLQGKDVKESFRDLCISFGALFLGFFAGSPFLVLDGSMSLNEVNAFFLRQGGPGPASVFRIPSFGKALDYLLHYLNIGMGWPLEILGILAVFFFLIRHQKKDILFVSLPIFYFCIVGNAPGRGRADYILPMVPFLYVGAAALMVRVSEFFQGAIRSFVLGIFVLGLIALPTARSFLHDVLLIRKDTRTLAKEWVETNLPPGARIAIERYLYLRAWVPPLLETNEQNLKLLDAIQRRSPLKGKMRKGLTSVMTASPRYTLIEITSEHHLLEEFESRYDIKELLDKEVRYVILSSFITDFKGEMTDPRARQFYGELRKRGRLIARFSPFKEGVLDEQQDHATHTPFDRMNLMERPGPVIEIYRLSGR